jgi:hypothetical protein
MILIIANEFDPHADAVVLALKRRGFDEVLRVDLETAHKRFSVEIAPKSMHLNIRHRSIASRFCDSRDVRTIWWRRSGFSVNRHELDMPTIDRLDQVEIYWALRWFIEAQPDAAFPFSHPHRINEANNKILQLSLAEKLDFITPQTVFTNDKHSLANFLELNVEVVLKPLHSPVAFDDKQNKKINLIARPVTRSKLNSALASNDCVAAYCQSRVSKRADIRVNVLPSSTIACEIAAGELPDSEVDWRPKTSDYTHKIVAVPDDVDKRCRRFIQSLELKWGIFDFGVTAADEWIFFECNPNGQWLWIEFKTGIPLSELIADELIRHHGAQP